MQTTIEQHAAVDSSRVPRDLTEFDEMRGTNRPVALDDELRWKAVMERDRSRDGLFYYAVVTTGVYCRPGCASRRPNRANVRFYDSPHAAEADGFRPCRRCQPRAASASPAIARIRRLCEYIDRHRDERLTLADLSRRSNMSASHLHRQFTAIVGVSPKQYMDARRMDAFKTLLREPRSQVTDAIFGAGYGSLSRVYEKVDTRLGMTPMEYRAGGDDVDITYLTAPTPLGLMMVGATDRGLCFVQFGDEIESLLSALSIEYPKARLSACSDPPPAGLASWMAALTQHLAGPAPDLELPLHVRATAFQMKVWTYLQTIPPGRLESYQQVAAAIGSPRGARAVARACAANHVALAIPCHRVIRGSGDLGGYKWGLARKRALIQAEQSR
jgi:AraC family transcriptional regulator of adaptative response/methylated-DNA-[protein]-cysteine methyltransferase